MICKDCGYDNPKGVYRCQRCGNSLVPTIPRDSYINPYPIKKKQKPKKKHSQFLIVVISVGVLILGVAALVAILTSLTNDIIGSNTEAYITEQYDSSADAGGSVAESYIEPSFIPEDYISEGKLQLPESDLKVGMPDYVSWASSSAGGDSDYSCSFDLGHGLTMNFYSYVADYPFSKSEEEEYFREDQNYKRLEGTNDQYFYTVETEDGSVATIIDRKNGRNYVIEVYIEESDENPSKSREQNKRAQYILDHEILDQSTMAETEQKK